MKRLALIALSLFPCFGLLGQGQDSVSLGTPKQEAHPMSWMEGRWGGKGFGGEVEETWLPSSGGSMLGTFRLVSDGKVSFYELMTIENRAEGPVMLLKHFNPDLSSWEKQDESRQWAGEILGEKHVRFGPVAYELTGEDELSVWVEVGEGEAVEEEEIVFKRLN